MITVSFPERAADKDLRFAVIIAFHQGKIIWCRHRDRQTWELPGGRREPDENIDDTARRELMEETGACHFTLHRLCAYAVTGPTRYSSENETTCGMLFSAEVEDFTPLEHEIVEIAGFTDLPPRLTYPDIQPYLVTQAKKCGAVVFIS